MFVFACLPVLLVLRMQLKNWINIPIWDEWDTPGTTLLHLAQHKLTWADLIAQHNESRKFFPRLIYIAMNAPLGWDVRYGMVLTFLSASALSVFLLQQLREAGKNVGAQALFAWFLINLLLFGPSESENYLCGYTFEILIPALALCGCIAVNLSDRSLAAKSAWNSILAVIATYSFAHGMILWALAVPLPSDWEKKRPGWARRWTFSLLVYFLIGAIAMTFYFVGYTRPEIAPPSATLRQAPLLGKFLIVWLGAVVKSAAIEAHLAGAVLAAVLFAACSMSAYVVWRERALWRRYYPWFLLLAFTLAVGLVSAIGRANLGLLALVYDSPEGFGSYRYKITSVLAYVAAVGLLYRLYRDWFALHAIWRPRFLIGIAVLTTLLGVAVLFLLPGQRYRLNAFQDNRRRARTAVMWSEALPQNPELVHAYPYPERFAERVTEMRKAGLIETPAIGPELIEAISHAPPPGAGDAGSLKGMTGSGTDTVHVAGWALIPGRDARADYVVLGWQSDGQPFHPLSAIPTGANRPDVSGQVSSAVRKAGFVQEINISELPPTPLTITAWAVDLAGQKAFPLDGTVHVAARPKN